MNGTLILSIIFLVIIVFILILAYFLSNRIKKEPREDNIEDYLDEVVDYGGWTDPEPIQEERGYCSIYTFPNQPTTRVEVVDQLQPVSGNPSCMDDDQLSLVKTQTMCEEETCINVDGKVYPRGSSVYRYQACSSLKNCQEVDGSFLSYLVFNFQPGNNLGPPNKCLRTGPQSSATTCTRQTNQLFRIIRGTPVTLVTGKNGPFAKIVNRANGRCLIPSVFPGTEGNSIVEGTCQPNQGYVWWLVPQLRFGVVQTSPQQIVYTDNVRQPPNDLVSYFNSNRALSIQIDSNGEARLLPYVKTCAPGNCPAQTQLVEYTLENYIANSPVVPF